MRRERRIGREGVGATAKHVPGELEQNYKRKRSFWTLFQCREFTSRRRLMDRQKPRPDNPVETVVLPEPSLRPASRQKDTTSADVTSLICAFSLIDLPQQKTAPTAVAQVLHRFSHRR